jgi:hypothetical protein
MLRRVITFLLLPCLLLAQSASLGHAHGNGAPAGHEARPHLHLAIAGQHQHTDGHRHHHGKDGHHHHGTSNHNDVAVEETGASPTTTVMAGVSEHESSHDDDALFTSPFDAAACRVNVQYAASDTIWIATPAFVPTGAYEPGREDALLGQTPPRPFPVYRKLYIQHLAILI